MTLRYERCVPCAVIPSQAGTLGRSGRHTNISALINHFV
jgi:hypothetical protein